MGFNHSNKYWTLFCEKKFEKMTIAEIKETSLSMINNLISKFDQSKVHLDLYQKLELNSDNQEENVQLIPKSTNAKFNQTLMNVKSFPHSKGKMYTSEQVRELGLILDRFPDDHAKICKSLKYQNYLLAD